MEIDQSNPAYAVCPFDSVHVILKSRMSTHLTRCKKNFPDYKQCPYNSNHYAKDLAEHIADCPNKKSNDMTGLIVGAGTTRETCNVVTGDEWDEGETYNPKSSLPSRDVIRVDHKLLPRAERKAVLEDERQRLNKVRKN